MSVDLGQTGAAPGSQAVPAATPAAPIQAPAAPAPAPIPPPLSATVAEAQLRADIQRMAAERDQALALANGAAGIREQLVRARVESAALSEGLVDPGLARYLPVADATVDAAGNVQGIDKVIAGWKSAAPGAFRPVEAPAATPTPVVVGQPAATPPAATPALPSFGPGHAAPPPNAPATAVDVRKLNKDQYKTAREQLRAASRAKDRSAGVN